MFLIPRIQNPCTLNVLIFSIYTSLPKICEETEIDFVLHTVCVYCQFAKHPIILDYSEKKSEKYKYRFFQNVLIFSCSLSQ